MLRERKESSNAGNRRAAPRASRPDGPRSSGRTSRQGGALEGGRHSAHYAPRDLPTRCPAPLPPPATQIGHPRQLRRRMWWRMMKRYDAIHLRIGRRWLGGHARDGTACTMGCRSRIRRDRIGSRMHDARIVRRRWARARTPQPPDAGSMLLARVRGRISRRRIAGTRIRSRARAAAGPHTEQCHY